MTRRREIVPDANLWHTVAKSVKPLQRHGNIQDAAKRDNSPRSGQEGREHRTSPVPSRIPPALTGLDRRSEQRMTRGNVAIDDRIDLHGARIADARRGLHQFLDRERRAGSRTVLVITGKGASPFSGHTLHGREHYHAPEREGRLRRLVPEWLHEPEFRELVAGFQPAHPKHGGGGAFYVRLRRMR